MGWLDGLEVDGAAVAGAVAGRLRGAGLERHSSDLFLICKTNLRALDPVVELELEQGELGLH